MILIVFSVTS